jgi:hypothetical protein
MTYQLPTEPTFPALVYAQDRVALATQFRADVVAKYVSNYENFWAIGRDEVGLPEMQAILDTLGTTGLQILTDSAGYVAGILASFPNELEEKYHSAPYEYTVEAGPRIVLAELKEAWQPQEDNGNQENQ